MTIFWKESSIRFSGVSFYVCLHIYFHSKSTAKLQYFSNKELLVRIFWELTLELARENTDIVDIFSFQDCRCFRFFDESLRFNDLMSQYAKIEGRNPTLVKVENSAYLNLIAKLNVTLDIPNGLSHYLLLLNDSVLDIACATFSVFYHEDYSND